MRHVGKPDEDSARKGANRLRNDVSRYFGPREASDRDEPDRDRRIEVRAADSSDCIDRHGHGDAPCDGYYQPASVLSFGFVEHDIRDHTISEKNEQHRSN